MIFALPAIIIKQIAIELSGLLQYLGFKKLSDWVYHNIAFPFQRDDCFKVIFPVSLISWSLVFYFIYRMMP